MLWAFANAASFQTNVAEYSLPNKADPWKTTESHLPIEADASNIMELDGAWTTRLDGVPDA
jgi:hypothetical protein